MTASSPPIPDTHAHLDEVPDLEAALARAAAPGVAPILTVGSDLSSSRIAAEIARGHPGVFAAVGVSPDRLENFDRDWEQLEPLLDQAAVLAVGEIGLDHTRSPSPRDLQLRAFRIQAQAAAARGLPISVHNREADREVLEVIAETGVRAALHCFGGSAEFAEQALAAGCYLSFAGNLTFPRAERLREIAVEIPEDRLLIESDSPVLSPQPWRGRPNEPGHLTATMEVLAQIRGVEPAALAGQLMTNAKELFGWKVPGLERPLATDR
ncbi:MAG: TatD family hydrolase [Chloroflexota bacterium]